MAPPFLIAGSSQKEPEEKKELLTQNGHNCITWLQKLFCWYALLLPKFNITEPGVQDKQKRLLP